MKRFILAVLAAAVLVGLGMYINRAQKTPVTPPEPVAEACAPPANDEGPQAIESVAATTLSPQAAGRIDDALAVWQRGAYLLPSDEKLRKKLAPAQ
jgi:hypothetical protein